MVASDAAFSRGDIIRRLTELEKRLDRLTTTRRLEAASVGAGGLRLRGGRLLAEDAAGERVFEVTTDPASIFMRAELISKLSAQVFADRIRTATVATFEGTSSTSSYTDLATAGPSVTIEITAARQALVFLTARSVNVSSPSFISDGKFMSVEVSGASSISPADAIALGQILGDNDPVHTSSSELRSTVLIPLDASQGLVAGSNTFTAKYRTEQTTFNFGDRSITVIGL